MYALIVLPFAIATAIVVLATARRPGFGRRMAASAIAAAVLIALTGWGTQEDKRKALAAGFDMHMTKPVDVDDLQRTLVRIWKERALERTG